MSDEPKKQVAVKCQYRGCDKVATRHYNFPFADSPDMHHLCEKHWDEFLWGKPGSPERSSPLNSGPNPIGVIY
ncbi:MAG TPA: hypothetical protein VG055_12665 [Planctomycetaceae bacterium]|jgi:hypothetical protein|nr:hypothetical protein [Planctomycetaceae bacterium]